MNTTRLINCLLTLFCLCAAMGSLPAFAGAQEGSWSVDEYIALVEEMEAVDLQREQAEPGSEELLAHTRRGIELRQELVALISRAFADNSLPPEFREPAATERLIFVQNIVVLLATSDDCDSARANMRLLDDAVESSDAELRTAREVAVDSVVDCEERRAERDAYSELHTPATEQPRTRPSARPHPTRTAGLSLIAAGGAMVVGGLVYDAVNAAGPRAEFSELRDLCPTDCDLDRMSELSGQINSARAPIGILIFGGIGVGTTGAIMTALAPRRNDHAVSVTPEWSPGYGGASVRVRW